MPLAPPWRRRKRPPRERLGHEQPGVVLEGLRSRSPASAVRSATSATARTGPARRCGRRWDTNQIPAEQYDAIRRTQLRFRVLPVVYGVVVASTALFFMLTGNVFSVFVLLPLSMMLWFYFVRPVHRRRYRRAIAELPRWELRPD